MKEQRLKRFIDDDLKVFSNLDNVRSIPSLIDGFKDSQRKCLYGLLSHGKEKIKVAQLASSASLVTHYAHGEGALASTIIGLAQKYPGSNNANLFEPIGQFGSILTDESASPRYIFTTQSKHLRRLFKTEDDAILKHREEEGIVLEPTTYLPIVPMWVVNGTVGIGTGHSTKILSRGLPQVLSVIKDLVSGKQVDEKDIRLKPYFEGWKGTVTQGDNPQQWIMTGTIEKVNTTTLKVTELPVQYGVDKYKEILIGLMDDGAVKDFDNNSNEKRFEFVISVPREIGRLTQEQLIAKFKLSAKFGENITLWDASGKLKRYDSVLSALQEFVAYRLPLYQVRKDHLISETTKELQWVNDKLQFIEWWNKTADAHLVGKDVIMSELNVSEANLDKLLALPIRSLRSADVNALSLEADALSKRIDKITNTKTTDMYLLDIKD